MPLHSRRVRAVAIIWFVAGLALTAAALLLVVGDERLGAELVLGPLAFAVAWRLWMVGCTVDEHGIEVVGLRSRHRVLWSTLDAVEFVPATMWGVPLRLVRQGTAEGRPVEATWGLSRGRRSELLVALGDHAALHGVDLRAG